MVLREAPTVRQVAPFLRCTENCHCLLGRRLGLTMTRSRDLRETALTKALVRLVGTGAVGVTVVAALAGPVPTALVAVTVTL